MDPTSVHEQDLGGTYQRYKTGQAKFTAWLREAAARVTAKPTEDPHGRLGYTLRLERMAQVVADGSSVGDIPEGPINMLRDVVLLRKGCAEFYRAAASKFKNGQLAKANATHNHMIFVLEQMLDKLEAKVCRHPKPSVSTANIGQAGESPETLAMTSLGTMFENLQVFPVAHDTSDNSEGEENAAKGYLDNPAASRRRKTKSKKGKKKQAPSPTDDTEWDMDDKDWNDQDEFDIYMVIYCLFEDFNKVRDHVIEKWCDYYYRDTDIRKETLAAITNAAYEIFQRMQEELEHHPANASPNTNLRSFTWIIGTLLASEMNEGESFVGIEEGNDFPQHDVRFGPAVLRVGVCTTDRASGEARKTIKECDFTEDQNMRLVLRPWAIMHSFFGDGRPLSIIPNLCPDHKDFSYLYGRTDPDALFDHDCFRTHDTVAFLFSLQLFVDVRRILETIACSAFHRMNGSARRVHAALVRHLNHIDRPNPHPHNQNLIRLLTRRIYEINAYLLRDPIHPPDYQRQESPNHFHLLRRDPVWAGLLSLRARLVAAKLGREACETPGGLEIVEAGARVYIAARAAYPGSAETTDKDTRMSPIEMLEVLEESLQSGLDGELDVDYFGVFDGSVRMLKALARSKMGKRLGLRAAWTDRDDGEGLVDVLFPLAWAVEDPKERKRAVDGMVKILTRVLDDMLCEEDMDEHLHDEHLHENPMDYEEEFPGKLPPKTRVVVRKTGKWSRGWGDDDTKVVNVVGPQPDTVTVDNELRDKFWSTHELSEKYDRFMEPRKM
ncbi:hypothetical protein B0T18DRAFT_433711 [Schizothecium vesticola]|uniref:DUF6604 domain-containing protein n=1 Tax=Schizothecium vesticola TaxID=314040 RepID=A0AA40EHF8_9PEZI|nr:hypothetical protein B0T18DRAFT_433711 [Schizothecium vesticola]